MKSSSISIEAMELEEEIYAFTKGVPESVIQVLLNFVGVFSVPEGLPQVRSQDHRIILKDGVNPVCLSPYRYCPLQKDINEKLIHEMLESGLI